MKQRVIINQWSGGLSDDEKYALVPNAFSFGQAVDFRHSPSILKLHRRLTKESGATVTSEVHDAIRVPDAGITYLAGGTEIYSRTDGSNGAAGTYAVSTTDANVIGVRDLDYNRELDTVFAVDQQVIHTLYNASTSPTWAYNTFAQYTVTTNDVSGSNYSLTNAVNEAASHVMSITFTREPLYSFSVEVNAKGTGTWTLTLHDSANNQIATASLTTANVPASGFAEFVFSSPVRIKLGATYHFHLTSSDSTGSVVSTDTTFTNGSYSYKAARLINTGDYGHAALQLANKTLICNERYVAEVEWNVTFDPHRLVLPSNYVGVNMTIYNEYAVIGCVVKSNADSLIGASGTANNAGALVFWDGVSTTFNFILEVPLGTPWNLIANNNRLMWVAGGRLQQWAGGDIETAYEMHGADEYATSADGPALDVYLRGARHGAAVSPEGLALFGYPRQSANTNLKVGVYSYGSIKSGMPYVAGYDYALSTGNTSVQFDTSTSPDTPITGITMVKQLGSNLLVAWVDRVSGSTTYGVDLVNAQSGVATTGSYESLWIDHDQPDKEKTAGVVKVTAKTLPSGVTIIPKIRFDRSASWENLTTGVAGDTDVRGTTHKRYKEVMIGYDITATTTSPEIISLAYEYDDNAEEALNT